MRLDAISLKTTPSMNSLAARHASPSRILPWILRGLLFGFLGTAWVTHAQLDPAVDADKVLVRAPGKIENAVDGRPQLTLGQPRATTDAGDFYRGRDGRPVRLLRSAQEVAVVAGPGADWDRITRSAAAQQPLLPVASQRFAKLREGGQIRLYQSTVVRQAPDASGLRRLAGVEATQPVFLDPESRMRLVPTGELLIRLKPGVGPAEVQGDLRARGLVIAHPVGSPRLQAYLVRSTGAAGDALALAEQLHGHPQLVWATPNFAREWHRDFVPNDPLFPRQQHLHNLGQEGAVPDADVDAVEAWDITQGNPGVVIAVIDDGLDTTLTDLRVFQNPGETGGGKETNGLDDDGNGLIDDVRGWDFVDDDNNTRPLFGAAHGTACAGIAAARLNNSARAAGIAGNCTILPVKIFDDFGFATSDDLIGAAISYAAEYADVLSNSWGGGLESAFIDDAIADAVALGRQGKGCPVFFASGNRGGNWDVGGVDLPIGRDVGTGLFSVGFRYAKDATFAFGEDLVRIDNVTLRTADSYTTLVSPLGPGGRQEFEGTFPPNGWTTASSTGINPWISSTNGALRGTMGVRSAQSGIIDDGEWTELRTPLLTLAGTERLVFQAYFSMEGGYDGLLVRLYDANGTIRFEYPLLSEDPTAISGVSYPARHPDVIAVGASTDCDRRADWSQFGAELDVVAPSNGGWNNITTLDATGTTGYSDTDFSHIFGGTSAATPLAAGIGALMISANPNLTSTQVRDALRATADKIGTVSYVSGFNTEYGYGRVNARRALDEVAPSIVTVTALGPTASETGATGAFLVSRTGPTGSALTVSINVGGTATSGVDYTALPAQVIIASGSRSNVVLVTPVNDVVVEPTETVVLNALPGAGYTLGLATNATVQLLDDDTQFVSVVASDSIAGEPADAGRFTVSRTGLTGAPLTVNLAVAGTASAGVDYVTLPVSVTLAAGASSTNIFVNPIDDGLAEFTETVVMSVVAGTGYELGVPTSATVELGDNEPAVVSVVAADNTALEPGLNTGAFVVSRTGSTASPVVIPLTLGGTAELGVDYQSISNVVLIPAGSVSVTIPVVPIEDPSEESPETVTVRLGTGLGYSVGVPDRAEVTLLDDDAVASSRPGVLALNGTTDAATTASTLVPSGVFMNSYTVELWCRPNGTQSAGYLVADDAFDLKLTGNTVEHVVYAPEGWGSTASYFGTLRAAEWNHVAITFDHLTREFRVAVNGVFGPSQTFASDALYFDLTQTFCVGGRKLSPKVPAEGLFQGLIDEVRVSDLVRYRGNFVPPKRFLPDLATRALYHFDEAAGTATFADASGRANHLTALGGAVVGAQFGPAGARFGAAGYWRFDENAGPVAGDASGNANHGALANGPIWDPAGWAGGSLSFDGVDDIVEVPNSTELELGKTNTDFTVSAWVNLQENATGAWRALMQKGAGTNRTFSLFLQPTVNRLHFRVSTVANWNEGGDSLGVLPVGTWTHVALVKSGNKLRLYLNATLDTEVTLTAPVVHNTLPLYLGKHPSLPGTRVKLDELRVFGRALSDRELLDQTALVGQWSFAEGTGSVARDGSPYRNDAQLAADPQTPSWVPNGTDSALAFDGVDDLATVPHSASLEIGRTNADFSVAFWLKLQENATGAWRALMQKGAGTNRTFSLFLPPVGNRFHFRVSTATNWNEGGDAITSIPTNVWTHVALVKAANKLRLYLGGVLDAERTLPTGTVHNELPLYLGKHPALPGTKSTLDDLRIYNRALTTPMLAELAAAAAPGATLTSPPPSFGGTSGGGSGGSVLSGSGSTKSDPTLAGAGGGHDFDARIALSAEVLVDEGRLVVRVPLPAGAESATWIIEGSEDLETWSPVAPDEVRTVNAENGEHERMRVRELRFPLQARPQFVRVRFGVAP